MLSVSTVVKLAETSVGRKKVFIEHEDGAGNIRLAYGIVVGVNIAFDVLDVRFGEGSVMIYMFVRADVNVWGSSHPAHLYIDPSECRRFEYHLPTRKCENGPCQSQVEILSIRTDKLCMGILTC